LQTAKEGVYISDKPINKIVMRRLIIFFLFAISLSAFAQTTSIPTIKVTGSAMVKVMPDVGVINIEVSDVKPKMGDAIKALTEKSVVYSDMLKRLGINEKDIRTTSFDVSKHQVYRNDETVDSGYIASQNIRVEFPYEQSLLQQLVTAFSTAEVPVRFSIAFELSEQLKVKVQSEIIDSSVKDATDKAKSIAKASGQRLGKILTITYGNWDQPKEMVLLERMRGYGDAGGGADVGTFNFTPEEIIFRDALTIEWIIR
jgi:hypothetical protein